MYVLAFDLSLNSSGYAVLEVFPDAPLKTPVKLIEKGLIKAKAKDTHHAKMQHHYNVFQDLHARYPDAMVVKEQLLFNPPKSAAVIAKVHGIADLVFDRVSQYYPSTIKLTVTGNGKADKATVAASVIQLLGGQPIAFRSDDESDAVAVGLTYFKMEG